MTIKIINFKVQETFTMVESLNIFMYCIRMMFGPPMEIDYHFDVVAKVNDDYIATARQLERGDYVQLPNGVRMMVWSVDRGGAIRMKTTKLTKIDLRDYHPIEMHLVYPRVHGHINDRAI